jgi:hypothetical protein
MGQSYGLRRIFLPAITCLDFSKYGHILGKTLCSGPQAPAWQASPWGHSPSSSAPWAVPLRLSRIGQHIKAEPCAKQRALLGMFSSRYSSVSRGNQILLSILNTTPLVRVLIDSIHDSIRIWTEVFREDLGNEKFCIFVKRI